jgi:hypothetical protein
VVVAVAGSRWSAGSKGGAPAAASVVRCSTEELRRRRELEIRCSTEELRRRRVLRRLQGPAPPSPKDLRLSSRTSPSSAVGGELALPPPPLPPRCLAPLARIRRGRPRHAACASCRLPRWQLPLRTVTPHRRTHTSWPRGQNKRRRAGLRSRGGSRGAAATRREEREKDSRRCSLAEELLPPPPWSTSRRSPPRARCRLAAPLLLKLAVAMAAPFAHDAMATPRDRRCSIAAAPPLMPMEAFDVGDEDPSSTRPACRRAR